MFHLNRPACKAKARKYFVSFSVWYTKLRTLKDFGNEILVNELSEKVCGPHVLRICQRVVFICGAT
jgi:hypothetical protein